MSPALAVPLFLVSLAVTLAAARLFARRLDRLGVRFGFPEALIGLLTAVAADGPNVASALFALTKGAHDVGVGVLVGSNTFQLAAMIGLSALIAGAVRFPRETVLLEGVVGVIVTCSQPSCCCGGSRRSAAVLLSALVVAPYLFLVVGGQRLSESAGIEAEAAGPRPSRASRARTAGRDVDRPDPPPARADRARRGADRGGQRRHGRGGAEARRRLAHPELRARRADPGPATSLPNAITAIRLGLAGRGAALVGETFNSNSINLGRGVIVPSLFVTFTALSSVGKQQLAWLLAMTVTAVGLLALPGGMRRAGAVVLVILYFAFVAGTLVGG